MQSIMNKICKPFFEETGLTYYNFVRIYNDNSRISLCSNKNWHDYFLKQDKEQINLETSDDGLSRKVIWDCLQSMRENCLIKDAREIFGIDHGCTLIINHTDFIEYHYFATKTGNDSINMSLYINNDALLYKFISSFKVKAKDLIYNFNKLEFSNTKFWNGQDRDKIYLKEQQRVHLEGKYAGIYLTKRQAQVFKQTAEGKTTKQIARKLDIGTATVETHIKSLKLKLNCTRQCFPDISLASGFSKIAAII